MIETERLIVRPWRDADRASYLATCNTDAVTAHLGGPASVEEIDAALERIRASQEENGFCFWAVERQADSAFLGFCGLKRMNSPGAPDIMQGAPEIGWRLREDAWGQGYAKEAALASLGLAFGRFGLDQVFAITMAGNAPSWGLMRRLGMSARPDLDFDMPVYGPHVTYRIGRDEWMR
jgi:RimJ/RimL family protein N-acetyltransferase